MIAALNEKTPVYDAGAIEALQQLLRENYAETVALFRRNSREYMGGIRDALEGGDAARVEFLAHKLASSAAQFGFLRLAETGRQLELAGEAARRAALFKRLENEFTVTGLLIALLAKGRHVRDLGE